ncbi:hypothetical protein ACU686_36840 [Yinghuangia aomiensis]
MRSPTSASTAAAIANPTNTGTGTIASTRDAWRPAWYRTSSWAAIPAAVGPSKIANASTFVVVTSTVADTGEARSNPAGNVALTARRRPNTRSEARPPTGT